MTGESVPRERANVPSVRVADVVITVMLLVVFVGGMVMARDFPSRAALVPRVVCGAGIMFCLLALVRFAWKGWTGRRKAAVVGDAPAELAAAEPRQVVDDGEGEEDEYVFASASRIAWAQTLGWFLGFFVVLALFGLLVTVPIFILAYLVLGCRVRVVWGALYAAISWALFYGVFDRLLHLTLPTGVLW